MIPFAEGGIAGYRFEVLRDFPGLRHAVFARRGGVSPAPFDSLNVGRGLGDAEENVRRNRRLVAAALGAEPASLDFLHQVHGRRVVEVPIEGRREGDAMVTGRPGRFLVIQTADCQAVLLWDPVRRVAGAVHSGWRGSVRNVLGRTVEAMVRRFGCRAGDIRAGVGPSLGPCCAEFVHYRREIPEALWKYRGGENRFDFWAVSRDQLAAAGLAPENVELSGLCTRCRTDLFFSYRGEGVTGRFAAVIGRET